MEPLVWLAVPFAVTGAVAVVLHRRDRRAAVVRDPGHEERAQHVARALGGRR